MNCLVLTEGSAKVQDIETAEGLVADRPVFLRNFIPVTGKELAYGGRIKVRLSNVEFLRLVFEIDGTDRAIDRGPPPVDFLGAHRSGKADCRLFQSRFNDGPRNNFFFGR